MTRLIDSASPAGSDLRSLGDDNIRAFKQAILDLLNMPNATTIAQKLFDVVTTGLDSIYLIDAAADPSSAGQIRRNGTDIRFHNGSSVVSIGLPAGATIPFPGISVPVGWLLCDGSAVSRTTFATLFTTLIATATVTITIASPGVVTWTATPLQNNYPVKFTTSGALPTGLVAGTTYYVKNKSANSFEVAATPGAASINTTGTQSGTHTGISAPHGDGDGSTTFNVPDFRGRVPAGRDDMGGAAANRMTAAGAGINGATPGASGGTETHVLTTAQLATHTHDLGNHTHGVSPFYVGSLATAGVDAWITTPGSGSGTVTSGGPSTNISGSSGSGTAHQNTQPTIMENWIIKT